MIAGSRLLAWVVSNWKLVGAGLLALAIGVGVLWVQGLRSDLKTAEIAAEDARKAHSQTIETLRLVRTHAIAAQAGLSAQLQYQQERAQRERAIREVIIHENDQSTTCADSPAMRAWLDSVRNDYAVRHGNPP